MLERVGLGLRLPIDDRAGDSDSERLRLGAAEAADCVPFWHAFSPYTVRNFIAQTRNKIALSVDNIASIQLIH